MRSIKRSSSVNSGLFQVIWDSFSDSRNRMFRRLKLEEIKYLQKRIKKREGQVVSINGKYLLKNRKMCHNLCKNVSKLLCFKDLLLGSKHIAKILILNLIKRRREILLTQLGSQQKMPRPQVPITTQQWKLEFQPVYQQSWFCQVKLRNHSKRNLENDYAV